MKLASSLDPSASRRKFLFWKELFMSLLERIQSKQARVGVIGLGYVGLPLVIEFCRAGFTVTGFDVDERKVEMLKRGESYIRHIDSSILARELNSRFTATADCALLAQMDCILICVPTP
jgi:UDP-N-acetyl-D-glucosamine dehydrogenase